MYIRKTHVTDELENLCSSFESNQKNVTRITNALWRIGITNVEQFKNTSIDTIVERIVKKTGQRVGVGTFNVLRKMHD
jgi:hypothetical protein